MNIFVLKKLSSENEREDAKWDLVPYDLRKYQIPKASSTSTTSSVGTPFSSKNAVSLYVN